MAERPRLLSVSSSRADIGILRPVWDAITDAGRVDLHVMLTGMHCAEGAPRPELPDGVAVHEGGADLGGRADARAGAAMGAITTAASAVIAEICPNAMFVIGDRLDMLPAALAALPGNLPVAHLHGGEQTDGAVDNRVRHALSQFASLHLVSGEDAQLRLEGMGIDPAAIRITGAPGLDTLRQAPKMSAAEFAAETGLPAGKPFVLLTVHPETAGERLNAPLDACLGGLGAWGGAVLVTAPNSDPGGADARARLIAAAEGRRDWVFIDTLGSRLYPNALRHAAFMLGNSSSGIIEAGLFGLPVIDVGDRQKGRPRNRNVAHAPNRADAVAAAIASLDSGLGGAPMRHAPGTPYGDGHSGPRVARALEAWLGLSAETEDLKAS